MHCISDEEVTGMIKKIGCEAIYREGRGFSHVKILDVKIDKEAQFMWAKIELIQSPGFYNNRPSSWTISSSLEEGFYSYKELWHNTHLSLAVHFDDDLVDFVVDGCSKLAEKFRQQQGYVYSFDYIGNLIGQYKEGNFQIDDLLNSITLREEPLPITQGLWRKRIFLFLKLLLLTLFLSGLYLHVYII